MTGAWKLYWLLAAVTFALYGVMVVWSLPYLSAVAGGLMPFDLLPTGYGLDQARTYLLALPPEGVRFYLGVQHRLDTAYPVMMAAVLGIALFHRTANWPVWLRLAVMVLPVTGALADYRENAAVAEMLRVGADGLNAEMVTSASQWSMLKAGATTFAAIILLGLLLLAGIRRLSMRKGGEG